MVFVKVLVCMAITILTFDLLIKKDTIRKLKNQNKFQRIMTVREILGILRDTENIQNQCEVFTTHDTNMREYIERKIADYERRERHIENELSNDCESDR